MRQQPSGSSVMIIKLVCIPAFLYLLILRAVADVPPTISLGKAVLLEFGDGGYGSGVLLSDETNAYLITARHCVLGDGLTRVPSARFTNSFLIKQYPGFPTNITPVSFRLKAPSELLKSNQMAVHPANDVAAIRFASLNDGKMKVAEWVTSVDEPWLLSTVATNWCKPYEQATVAANCVLVGFPRSLGIDHKNFDPDSPLLRSGRVAGKDAKRRRIILDCASYPGNSGGPVFELEDTTFHAQLHFIGIVVENIPFSRELRDGGGNKVGMEILNSGYSVVEPVDAILETIKRLGPP